MNKGDSQGKLGMNWLDRAEYEKVLPLLQTDNDLSVLSVIYQRMPGGIFVNDVHRPTAALFRTSECNLVAGRADDEAFNRAIAGKLSFWDSLTPDNKEWEEKIPFVHENRYIRKYTRCHYRLIRGEFVDTTRVLADGFVMEEVNPDFLRRRQFLHSEDILETIENWRSDETFIKNGGGTYIRSDREIVSYSPLDCSYLDRAEIGIHTTGQYRGRGFGILAAAATAKSCFKKGYESIGWNCVATNKGSRAIAEKLGFRLVRYYPAFSSYPPIENVRDLSREEWKEWALYLEDASKSEPRLWSECLYAYIKANDPAKAREALSLHQGTKPSEHDISALICYLHTMAMAEDFADDWAGTL